MKKCKILISFVDGEHNSYTVGNVYEMTNKLADALIEAGIAELVEEPNKPAKKRTTKRKTAKKSTKKVGGEDDK